MSRIAAESGLAGKQSFNTDYETYLPQARGHVLLVESHTSTPIIPLDVREDYSPGSARGLRQSDGIVRVENTILVFLDSSTPRQNRSRGWRPPLTSR